MRVYCDMDDVICETAAALCRLAEREFGVRVPYRSVRDFDLQKTFGLTDAEMRRFMAAAHERDCLLSYEATEGAAAGLRALRAAGCEVEVVTGRPASSHEATEEWLSRAGLGGFAVTYVDKYGREVPSGGGVPETLPLPELLKRRYDVAIDDSPMVLPALSSWTDTKVLVFDRPWNAALGLSGNMTRVDGWESIGREFRAAGVLPCAVAG